MGDIKIKIEELEGRMREVDFWSDKQRAAEAIRELNQLKSELAGEKKWEEGPAIVTIFAGAGGDDAEDFAAMLFSMYTKYADGRKWSWSLIHKNENDHGGYRNITFEVVGKGLPAQAGAYGTLKSESGVHRLVRISPFNAKKLRHTSFAMVEILPKFAKGEKVQINDDDLRVEFARSSGPGGQNVNKRETAVRIVHLPTNIAVHADGERTQSANRDRAMEILQAKLYKRQEEARLAVLQAAQISKTTEAEWGNQIRSYVLHPYKLVKDHRTGIETSQVDEVLGGDIELFLKNGLLR